MSAPSDASLPAMDADATRLAAAFNGAGPIDELATPPASVDAAYALQDAVRGKLALPLTGWKLAQTTPKAQAAAGIDAPTVAPLLDGMIVPSETVFAARRFYKPEAEAEIAIELAAPINGVASAQDVAGAASGFRIAIELADTRYVDKLSMGTHGVIADMNSSSALVVGPLMPMDRLEEAVGTSVTTYLGDGSRVETLEADMRPSPLEVVAFLTKFLAVRDAMLPAGTIVTTGTHTLPTLTAPGVVAVEFSGFERVTARLAEAWS